MVHLPSDTLDKLSLGLVEGMLDHIPSAPFFAKDRALRFVAANAAMLSLCGAQTRSDVLGKSGRDFFAEHVWTRYEAVDRQIMRTRKPVKDQLDFCVRVRGRPVWLLMSRWPMISGGQVEGIVAIARMLDGPDRRHPAYERLSAVVEYLRENIAIAPEISEAARMAGVSVARLERDFSRVFGVTPQRYLNKIRFELALDLLKAGGPIVEVAHACGYTDQSAFARQFRTIVGMSPTEFRRSL